MRMKIGMKAPTVRVPCLNNNKLDFLQISDLQKGKLALCCLPSLIEKDAWFLEAQVREFKQFGTDLAILVSTDDVLGVGWTRSIREFSLPIFIDPLLRLRKAFRLSPILRSKRCETLIFDAHTRLRFRLLHELNLTSLAAVLDILASENLLHVQANLSAATLGMPDDSEMGLPTITRASTSKV